MYLNGNDSTYLLDFVDDNNYLFSYAASFGYLEIPHDYKNKIISSLKRFDGLSVREDSAYNLLTKYGFNSELVLDPTLLLSGTDWANLIEDKRSRKKYVFVYLVAYTPKLLDIAKRKAKELGCELWVMHYNYFSFKECKNIRVASPLDFLKYIYEAECVFCSSFHAICFSILFHKDFYYALDDNRSNNNSRIESLCTSLHLQCRNVENNVFSKINFEIVDSLLKKQREISLNFISHNILSRELD